MIGPEVLNENALFIGMHSLRVLTYARNPRTARSNASNDLRVCVLPLWVGTHGAIRKSELSDGYKRGVGGPDTYGVSV